MGSYPWVLVSVCPSLSGRPFADFSKKISVTYEDIDKDKNAILTDDTNWTIPDNTAIQMAPPVSGNTWWPILGLMPFLVAKLAFELIHGRQF